jgi:hypothetical protein
MDQHIRPPLTTKQKIETFFAALKLFFVIIVLVLLIYTLYIVLFSGYPRWLLNILTFSFYHRDNVEKLLKEGLLEEHIQYLARVKSNLIPSPLYSNCAQFIEFMKSYEEYNHDMYFRSFRDYYYYYYKVYQPFPQNIPQESGDPVTKYYVDFYNALAQDLIAEEKLTNSDEDQTRKSDDQVLLEAYTKGQSTFERIMKNLENLKIIRNNAMRIKSNYVYLPITAYLVLPDSQETIESTVTGSSDYMKIIDEVHHYDESIVDVVLDKAKQDPKMFYMIQNYLNLPLAKAGEARTLARQKILKQINQELFDLIEKYPILFHIAFLENNHDQKKELEKRKKYCETMMKNLQKQKNSLGKLLTTKGDPKTLGYIAKSNDLLNLDIEAMKIEHDNYERQLNKLNDPRSYKKELYKTVIQTYSKMLTGADLKAKLTSLMNQGQIFKNVINSANVIELYLYEYQKELTKTINKHNITIKSFFPELFNPYMQDILITRMGGYFKKTFSSANWKGSYERFRVQWALLGKMLKDVIKSIIKSFHTSSNVQQPVAP